ncbi:unnamed protein product [Amoebophrya sp. A25]|nr:unnamed protein product [Amoebophrya sp. A25]|eukprot:GSA25T00020083001.1
MPSAFRSLLNPYPARLLPEEGALTTLQGTVLEAKFMSTLWNAPGYPLNMLCQKLLICDEYAHHRGRLGVLTPFQLTWCMVLREPVHKSWQGFGFLLLHVYVRDWQRIWANHLLVPRLLPLWLAIRKQIRRAWALIPAFRSIPRVVLSGARHSGRRICGVLFGLFSLEGGFSCFGGGRKKGQNGSISNGGESGDGSDQVIVLDEQGQLVSGNLNSTDSGTSFVSSSSVLASGQFNNGQEEASTSNATPGAVFSSTTRSDQGGSSSPAPSRARDSSEQANGTAATNNDGSTSSFESSPARRRERDERENHVALQQVRQGLRYLTEVLSYPFLILQNRAVFVPGKTTDFWRLNLQTLRLYGPASFFDGLPLYLCTLLAEDAIQELINRIVAWKLSDLSAMDLTMVRLSFGVLFGQFLSPVVQLVTLRRGEASYFIAKNRLPIQALGDLGVDKVPPALHLPEHQPLSQLSQRMCLRTFLYQLGITGVIVSVNYGAAYILNLAEREERQRREDENRNP